MINYQLALRKPGINPELEASLNAIRDNLKLRYTDRPRPVKTQRLFNLELKLSEEKLLTINLAFQLIAEGKLLLDEIVIKAARSFS